MNDRNLYDPIFRKPSRPKETKLWRYLTPSKFATLVSSSSIYLAKVDSFTDKLEGQLSTLSQAQLEAFETYWQGNYDPEEWKKIEKDFRTTTFASCWHINDHESLHMWKEYCGLWCGILIQTTFDKLDKACAAIPHKYFLGSVNYVMDWTTLEIPLHNVFYRFTHKDGKFYKEQEARILATGDHTSNHLLMDINVTSLLENIYLHPRISEVCRKGFTDALEEYFPSLSSLVQPSIFTGITLEDLNL